LTVWAPWWRELQLAAERFSLGLLNDFLPNAVEAAHLDVQRQNELIRSAATQITEEPLANPSVNAALT
jgi:hypothetical protein